MGELVIPGASHCLPFVSWNTNNDRPVFRIREQRRGRFFFFVIRGDDDRYAQNDSLVIVWLSSVATLIQADSSIKKSLLGA